MKQTLTLGPKDVILPRTQGGVLRLEFHSWQGHHYLDLFLTAEQARSLTHQLLAHNRGEVPPGPAPPEQAPSPSEYYPGSSGPPARGER